MTIDSSVLQLPYSISSYHCKIAPATAAEHDGSEDFGRRDVGVSGPVGGCGAQS